MSMEIYVFSNKHLSSIGAWQEAIDTEHFALALNTERPIGKLQGLLPVIWNGNQTGFECDHRRPNAVIETYPNAHIDSRWKYCLAFRWGADVRACLGAYMGASAYAKATDGVVFDPDAGKTFTPQQAKQMAIKIEKEMPSFERAIQSALSGIERRFRPLS
jgi:hypothetical protein